ncbi:MAG: TonB-dependent receptor [Desulfobacterales bacterium]|nr:TonB-dependent receptor [Desulfobacterales bacterium]
MFAPRGFQSYDSETLWNYELGLKSQLLDRRLQINTAVYYMDISDKQVQTALSPCVKTTLINSNATAKPIPYYVL